MAACGTPDRVNLGAAVLACAINDLRGRDAEARLSAYRFLYSSEPEFRERREWVFSYCGLDLPEKIIMEKLEAIKPTEEPGYYKTAAVTQSGIKRTLKPRILGPYTPKPCKHCLQTPFTTPHERKLHLERCLNLKRAAIRERGYVPEPCRRCGADDFPSALARRLHYDRCKRGAARPYGCRRKGRTCPACGDDPGTAKGLWRHLQDVHKEQSRAAPRPNRYGRVGRPYVPLPCIFCGEEMLLAKLDRHECKELINAENMRAAGAAIGKPLRQAHQVGQTLQDQGVPRLQKRGRGRMDGDAVDWEVRGVPGRRAVPQEAALSRPRHDFLGVQAEA